ncbi:DNA-directed RNA polymerase subunit alpha [Candidatus Megaera venefica]|jgi:DNA-directed RNA polymerase subunit alpha|uniref:DNA-directed RNA polymerase subunit alpha n=1 Tax=Candidatus Megaera venefica TaxID=2055910 RepID=A0ABU5NAJ2_9RICK|nr:DNA-directed RNA polymerase subunit alpha [Candidatus Megaera venefica]MBY0533339.1 DNA-directed RNA polymerase subunit alpha [Rickettsiaceae bacterium]MEA0970181.1 DNA-directed RNA polymerase subunit alpha [Candidatus Megaera venefica]
MLSLNKNWSSLIKPSKITYDGKNDDNNIANIIIEPLERGFGLTIGNALRRVLLSSLQGAAITAVKIPGVVHEFSAKSGVKEDLIDIILNLKKVAVKIHSSDKKTLRINAKGPCVVTAGMIESGSDVEILNPDQMICTLSKDVEFEMELYCETGKGYVPAGNGKMKDLPIGVIAIDALFSPVKKVSYKVEDTRVGQITDYDKLIMNVETDGTISPEMAIALSARILQDQLQLFITFEEVEEEKHETKEELEYNPILLKKVDELELSVRSRNCLQNDNIVYIGDLVNKTEAEMLRTQNFGRKSLNEIKDVLEKFKLKFGMEVSGWPPENIEELAKKYEDSY